MDYASHVVVASVEAPGVSFVVAKMSFGRRIELAKQMRELARRAEFLEAGSSPEEKMEAAVLSAEVERAYVLWGVSEVIGLTLDGEPATPASLVERGPEDLFHEAAAAVKAQCSLSEAERKN